MPTTDETTPYSAEQVMAELHAAGGPLTGQQLADRLVRGRATPPEWWRVMGVIERITYHPGSTVIRFLGRAGAWCYVHREHAPAALDAEAPLPDPAALDLRDAGDADIRHYRGRASKRVRSQ